MYLLKYRQFVTIEVVLNSILLILPFFNQTSTISTPRVVFLVSLVATIIIIGIVVWRYSKVKLLIFVIFTAAIGVSFSQYLLGYPIGSPLHVYCYIYTSLTLLCLLGTDFRGLIKET